MPTIPWLTARRVYRFSALMVGSLIGAVEAASRGETWWAVGFAFFVGFLLGSMLGARCEYRAAQEA